MRTILPKPLPLIPLVLSVALFSGCAGTFTPPPPLWDASLYNTVAVLPVRMTVATGRPPFTSEDTELSDTMGGKMQEALSIVMRYRGYKVLPPGDLSERLMNEKNLSEAFVALAASQGLMGPDQKAPLEDGMKGAALIGKELGADLLVLAYGRGEFHSVGENLVQGLVTGLLSRGREQYQASPSFLQANIYFVDPVRGSRIAAFTGTRIDYESKIIPLSKLLNRALRRIPVKQDVPRLDSLRQGSGQAGQAEGRTPLDRARDKQDAGEMPKP